MKNLIRRIKVLIADRRFEKNRYAEAFKLYLSLADASPDVFRYEYCRFRLGECYLYGYGTPVDCDKALACFSSVIDFHSARDKIDEIQSAKILKKLDDAQNGDEDAQAYVKDTFGEDTLAHIINNKDN